jgi:hypothetical protein
MPKAVGMAHLSRPYQIALAAAVAALGLFAVWSLALHHPGSEPSAGPGSTPSAPAASAPAASASSSHAGSAAASAPAGSAGSDATPGGTTPVYHGSAPGVEGLSRAIDRAHGAVATSEQNAKQLGEKSAQASQEAVPSTSAPSAPAASASATASAATGSASARSAPAPNAAKTPAAAVHKIAPVHTIAAHKPLAHKLVVVRLSPSVLAAAVQAAQQAQLKQELARGKTVLLLFWNPKSTDDVEVRKQVQAVAAHLKGQVAAHVALAGQVGQYGSVTRDVQIFQTPTLLIVGKHGLAVTLTGLMDQYAIEQGILEAKKL